MISSKNKNGKDTLERGIANTHESIIKGFLSTQAQISETGCTQCAFTARINARVFGIYLPLGNAFSALEHPAPGCVGTLPKGREHELPGHDRDSIGLDDFENEGKNTGAEIADIAMSENNISQLGKKISVDLIADLAVDSDTPKGRIYGHRVLAFKFEDKWYVFDPYVKNENGESIENGIPIETYVNKYSKKIIKCNFYKSLGYDPTLLNEYRKKISSHQSIKYEGEEQKAQAMVNEFIINEDNEKTNKLYDRIMSGDKNFQKDDILQLIDDNEGELLSLLCYAGGLRLDYIFDIIKDERPEKKAIFINMCRCMENVDETIQKEILGMIEDNNSDIKGYIDAASYYRILKNFNNLDNNKIILISLLAYSQFFKSWDEEKGNRQYHFDEKYETNNLENRKKYQNEILELLYNTIGDNEELKKFYEKCLELKCLEKNKDKIIESINL